MNKSFKLIECVPNFSEGRNKIKIDKIKSVISNTQGAKLLDIYSGKDTNRTVVTFIGSPDSVFEASFRAIKKAAVVIDMSRHNGIHPRIGATDVCPFIPVSGVNMEDCVELARRLGKTVGAELHIPVYLYEEAALKPDRKNLSNIRNGEYEGLSQKLKNPDWRPDFGPAEFNQRTGATVVGARDFLIAYNINLNTKDTKIAQEIASTVRESGRPERDGDGKIIRHHNGRPVRIPGKFKACKAVGWYTNDFQCCQISINLTNYRITPLHIVFDECRRLAEKLGVRVTGSELVGLIPLEAMLQAGRYYLEKQVKKTDVPDSELIHTAIHSLGFNELSHFEPEKKIFEYRIDEES